MKRCRWRALFETDNHTVGSLVPPITGNLISGTVPEPQSWALMIAGFGLVGVAARRRKVAVAA